MNVFEMIRDTMFDKHDRSEAGVVRELAARIATRVLSWFDK